MRMLLLKGWQQKVVEYRECLKEVGCPLEQRTLGRQHRVLLSRTLGLGRQEKRVYTQESGVLLAVGSQLRLRTPWHVKSYPNSLC